MQQSTRKNLLVRTISGAALLVVVLGSVMLSPWSFLVLLVIIAFGCVNEFYRMASRSACKPQRMYGITATITLILVTFFSVHHAAPHNGHFGITIAAMVAVTLVLPFFLELYRKTDTPLQNVATTLTGIVYVGGPLAVFLLLAFRTGVYQPAFALAYFVIVWANDVGAYLVGITFGRHKLFERISPKKSWEGFAGGVIFAIGASVVAALLMDSDLLFWGGLGAAIVVGGVMGDLVESMFKRSIELKDSGGIIPGHGGFLDRFDALLLSLPVVLVYFAIFRSYWII